MAEKGSIMGLVWTGVVALLSLSEDFRSSRTAPEFVSAAYVTGGSDASTMATLALRRHTNTNRRRRINQNQVAEIFDLGATD